MKIQETHLILSNVSVTEVLGDKFLGVTTYTSNTISIFSAQNSIKSYHRNSAAP